MRRLGVMSVAVLLLALCVAYVRWHDSGAFRALDHASFDLRLRLRPPLVPSDEVAILVIDDATLQRLGHWPPPRAALATAFTELAAAGASVVALDLLLLEAGAPGSTADDADRLVTAVKRHPKPVLAMAFGFAEPVPMHLMDRLALRSNALPIVRSAPDAEDLLGPPAGVFLQFRPLADLSRLGHVNVFVEPSGVLRFIHPAIRLEDAWYPALAVQAAALHQDLPADAQILDVGRSLTLGAVTAPLDAGSRLVLNAYGPPQTFRHHSLIDFLDGTLDPAIFAGRVVVIGATATGVRDSFGTALHPRVTGVEIFATVIDNLLTGRFIDRSAQVRDLDLGLIVAATSAALVLLAPLPLPALAGLAMLLLVLPFAVATLALLAFGIWLNMVFATLGAVVVTLAAFGLRFRRLRQRGRQHEARSRTLERYVSPLLRDKLAAAGSVQRSQAAAILFCDLEGFTGAAEPLEPARVQQVLQRYYELIEQAAVAHGGVVAGYTGDGAMLIFGLPEPSPGDPARAIACGEAMLAAMPGWQAMAEEHGVPRLNLRIGINYGRVEIGHVGGGDQIQLAATGDVVNVASRLQHETRTVGTAMLVAATAVEVARAHDGERAVARLQPRQALSLRGRAAPVSVFALATTA
jgi:adenylate cyclase